jgi:hypothetical protein
LTEGDNNFNFGGFEHEPLPRLPVGGCEVYRQAWSRDSTIRGSSYLMVVTAVVRASVTAELEAIAP